MCEKHTASKFKRACTGIAKKNAEDSGRLQKGRLLDYMATRIERQRKQKKHRKKYKKTASWYSGSLYDRALSAKSLLRPWPALVEGAAEASAVMAILGSRNPSWNTWSLRSRHPIWSAHLSWTKLGEGRDSYRQWRSLGARQMLQTLQLLGINPCRINGVQCVKQQTVTFTEAKQQT